MDPLPRLFGSFARLKILRLFFFNDDTIFSLADVAFRTKTPKDVARKELNTLVSSTVVRKRSGKGGAVYLVNKRFDHFEALQTFLRTSTTLGDAAMVNVFKRAGNIRLVVLSGIFTGAVETKIDVLLVGDKLEDKVLDAGVRTLEAELGRELRFAAFSTEDFRYRLGVYDRLLRDVFDFPHRTLVDKIGLREG
jgi:hypothetical protein